VGRGAVDCYRITYISRSRHLDITKLKVLSISAILNFKIKILSNFARICVMRNNPRIKTEINRLSGQSNCHRYARKMFENIATSQTERFLRAPLNCRGGHGTFFGASPLRVCARICCVMPCTKHSHTSVKNSRANNIIISLSHLYARFTRYYRALRAPRSLRSRGARLARAQKKTLTGINVF